MMVMNMLCTNLSEIQESCTPKITQKVFDELQILPDAKPPDIEKPSTPLEILEHGNGPRLEEVMSC